MDHTAKLWDAGTGRVRQTFRGHVDSVNAVAWQPFAVHLATASGDKTVSLWDARTGLCVQVRRRSVAACHAASCHPLPSPCRPSTATRMPSTT